MISFSSSLPVEDTLVFEALFEEQLQLEAEDKIPMLANGIATWMFVDGKLAGETYGITPRSLAIVADDEIEDCDPEDDTSIYCYSTAILPQFQGRGLGKLLKAHWLGKLAERGVARVVGHSTSPAAMTINHYFGARDLASHEKWYDTGRTATFYELAMDTRSTVQQSMGDCGLACVEYLMRAKGRTSVGRARMSEIGHWTDADGIPHDGIEAILMAMGGHPVPRVGSILDAPLMSIVGYQWEGDGHYGVFIKHDAGHVFIFNPAFGKIDRYDAAEFDRVAYSKRYGPPGWSLSCTF